MEFFEELFVTEKFMSNSKLLCYYTVLKWAIAEEFCIHSFSFFQQLCC